MSHNPYATPNSDVVDTTADQLPLYSPTQAACGALLGGPVGLIYFVYANFKTLGNDRLGKNTLIYGVLLISSLLAAALVLPKNFPSAPFTVAYIVAARYLVARYQMTKQGIIDSPQYQFHSNWRVAGFGVLSFLGSVLLVIGPLMALSKMGIVV